MEAKIISKTVAYGEQRWRINPDGSYSALAFGCFPFDKPHTPRYGWIDVEKEKVPSEVKKILTQ